MKEVHIKRNDPQLSEIQRGGLKAFETLFRQYYAVLCAYGHKYVDFHDAEEIARLPSMDMGKPGKPNY